jgi:hypothetical protein
MAEIDGLTQVQQRLTILPQEVQATVARALFAEATEIMARSQPLVPVDTGLLRSTGTVETENTPGPEAVVTLSYGGAGIAPYAAVVHFRTDVHHPVGQAFYLQQPFFEATAGMAERLAAVIRQALGAS